MQYATCTACAAVLEMVTQGTAPLRCYECGSPAIAIHDEGTNVARVTLSYEARTLGGSILASRIEALCHRLVEAEHAARGTDLGLAERAVKATLELLHELNDERHKRNVWSYESWAPSARDLWTAHMAARNALHHGNIGLLEVRQGTGLVTSALWSDAEITDGYNTQRRLYNELLRGQPVFPMLRQVADLALRELRR